MRVLIACEFSGVVRDAFIARGHDAWSCDLEPTEKPGPHIVGDVRDVIDQGWDMMIAFPPCTHLALSGARWFTEGRKPISLQEEALAFVCLLMEAPIRRIAIENPVGAISSHIRKPDQILQPFQFGHPEKKKTCLWLKGLPPPVSSAPDGRAPAARSLRGTWSRPMGEAIQNTYGNCRGYGYTVGSQ